MTVKWNGPVTIEKVRRGALVGVVRGIGIVEARAVYLITQTAKTGALYRRRGKLHRASAPGQAFASDTGDTLNRRDTAIDAAAIRARLTFRSVNALRMEKGTRKIKPRPYAGPALAQTGKQVQDAIVSAISRELSK